MKFLPASAVSVLDLCMYVPDMIEPGHATRQARSRALVCCASTYMYARSGVESIAGRTERSSDAAKRSEPKKKCHITTNELAAHTRPPHLHSEVSSAELVGRGCEQADAAVGEIISGKPNERANRTRARSWGQRARG